MTNGSQLFRNARGSNTTLPVVCLGMSFPSDTARREHFLAKLREKLNDSTFREIDGFPLGNIEDILALSDPPYYTACPNPFLGDLIRHYGRGNTQSQHAATKPFASDVTEGKN